MYVIKKRNVYVSRSGNKHSYTTSIRNAKKYKYREHAELSKCENEFVVSLISECAYWERR